MKIKIGIKDIDIEQIKEFLDSLIEIGEKAFEENKNNKELLKSLQVVIFYKAFIEFLEKEKSNAT